MRSMLIVCASLFVGAALIGDESARAQPTPADKKPAEAPGMDEVVGDTVSTHSTRYSGTVALHTSVNSAERFYIAPRFMFVLIGPERKEIARPTRTQPTGTVPVQMVLEVIHPEVRDELKAIVVRALPNVTKPDIRNLQVDSIRVGVASADDRREFGVIDFVRNNPPAEAEKLPITLSVDASKAAEFTKAVNEGTVNFVATYSYNRISLDSRFEMLRTRTILETQKVRELAERGAEIMTAKQMADAATNIKREIESKVIEGIGEIEPQSLKLEQLIGLFSVGKTWEKSEEQLEEMDKRLLKQFDLKIDSKDFQPFRFQKKVVEVMAREAGLANKKKAYFDLYRRNASSMKGSAGLKIGPFGASTEYSNDFEQKLSKGQMTDEEFLEHVKSYHGAEYTTLGVLERGIELYDLQKVRSQGELKLISVTLKPTAGKDLRNVDVMPSVREAGWVEHRRSLTKKKRDLEVKLRTEMDKLAEASKPLEAQLQGVETLPRESKESAGSITPAQLRTSQWAVIVTEVNTHHAGLNWLKPGLTGDEATRLMLDVPRVKPRDVSAAAQKSIDDNVAVIKRNSDTLREVIAKAKERAKQGESARAEVERLQRELEKVNKELLDYLER